MNRRLEAICRLIPEGRGVIDVGTDHGYLPVKLYKDGYSGQLFASDIRPGPLSAAKLTANREGIGERISFFLCDGLDDCPPEKVDTIVIAGMGGDTICGILDRAEWCMSPEYYLVLQPMTKAEVLRFWLINNGFSIEREELVWDGDLLYQVLTARYCGKNTKLSDAELYLGAFAKRKDCPLFLDFLSQQKSRLYKRIDGLLSGVKGDRQQLLFLQGIAAEMQKMEERLHDEGI